MNRLGNMQSVFPSLCFNLRKLNESVTSNTNGCKALRTLGPPEDFIQSHPIISLFLAISVVLGFLPIILLAALVFSPFLVVSLSVVTVFGGTFLVASFSFLVILFPALLFGTIMGVFAYLAYRVVVNALRIIKHLKDMVLSLPSRIFPVLNRFDSFKEQPYLVLKPPNEETSNRNYLYRSESGVMRRNYSDLGKVKFD